jgi:stage II sporulation protein D
MKAFAQASSQLFRQAMLVLVCMAPALAQTAHQRPDAHLANTLRAGLWTLWHDKAIAVLPAPGREAALRMCESCAPTPITGPTRIRTVDNRLQFGGREAGDLWLSGTATLEAHGESLLLSYPLHMTARSGELILAITLPVETYVERVVASESGSTDSPESLKALAIVVRTFALHLAHGHAAYDLCDSTHCQLLHWAGNSERRSAAHAATLATAGETLWFRGQRAQAWFHQNCGGRTASPSDIWPGKGPGKQPMPWLVSHTDSYCTAGGAREWSANLSLADLTRALAAAGLVRPGWTSIAISRRADSGRAVTLRIDATEIAAEDFRLAVGRTLGWNRILSNWFEVSRQGDHFQFHGRGSGHGVGLCQTGAAAMAAGGSNSSQILAQYFPGATAADEASGLAWQALRGEGFAVQTLDAADQAYLPELNRAFSEAESRSGIKAAEWLTVRAFRSTPAFRDATLAPGWVAAFTEGNWIGVQPLRTLSGRKLLAPVLRHEFLHALVESQATAATPLWLREGLVEAWSGEANPDSSRPALRLDGVDRALAKAATEAQSQAAHHAARWYAARLIALHGRAQVISWLRSGVPASALAALN